MNQTELSKLTNEELLAKAKKLKSNTIINAFLIGLCIGVVAWSILQSNFGFLMLIPLFIIYKLINNSKHDKVLKEELRKRNLK